ncbi:MAG: PAS domain-containing protein, partial [Alphaproteobacteria bacterium]|nr:PAS domain-containing protein [Alphaproteobacteria bacterium]
MLGLVGPTIGSSWYALKIERDMLEKAFRAETEQMVHVLAQGMREPVWNLIPESGQALLASMMEDERVLSINVTSVAQGPFLATRRGGQGADSGAGNILTRDILYDGGRIGTVALEIDSSQRIGQFYFQSWRIYLANGVQLAFGIAVVTLVIWVLARLQRAQAYRQANVALQTEVGERARAEQALQESEARLLQAQRMAHLGHWTWHIEEDKTYWSEEHYRIFGLPPSNDPIDADAFFAQVDEADRENIHAAVDRCLATGEPYELEFGITRPDGARRAVFTRAEIEYDAAGNPKRAAFPTACPAPNLALARPWTGGHNPLAPCQNCFPPPHRTPSRAARSAGATHRLAACDGRRLGHMGRRRRHIMGLCRF